MKHVPGVLLFLTAAITAAMEELMKASHKLAEKVYAQSAEQQQRFLVPLARGEKLGAFCRKRDISQFINDHQGVFLQPEEISLQLFLFPGFD